MTNVRRNESMSVRTAADIVLVRQRVRHWTAQLGFSLVDQTKVITAASELARNTVDYGGGGSVMLEELDNVGRRGLRLTFSDEGPGIADIAEALRDGFTSGNGLGMGLGGARRLMNEFEIDTTPGKGTRIAVVKWTR